MFACQTVTCTGIELYSENDEAKPSNVTLNFHTFQSFNGIHSVLTEEWFANVSIFDRLGVALT